jgi:hypothetical protein
VNDRRGGRRRAPWGDGCSRRETPPAKRQAVHSEERTTEAPDRRSSAEFQRNVGVGEAGSRACKPSRESLAWASALERQHQTLMAPAVQTGPFDRHILLDRNERRNRVVCCVSVFVRCACCAACCCPLQAGARSPHPQSSVSHGPPNSSPRKAETSKKTNHNKLNHRRTQEETRLEGSTNPSHPRRGARDQSGCHDASAPDPTSRSRLLNCCSAVRKPWRRIPVLCTLGNRREGL